MKSLAVVLSVFVLMGGAGCGNGDQQAQDIEWVPEGPNVEHLAGFPFDADTLLRQAGKEFNVVDSVSVWKADAMAAGRAANESYLQYDIIGVAAATYKAEEIPLRVEVAQFAEPIDAYGWYSIHRPNGVMTDTIGRQSFRMGSLRYVYKGDYAIVVDAGDTSSAALAAVNRLAGQIAGKITEEARLSPYHILFPSHDRVAGSDRYYGYAFLGAEKVNEVYTMDFASGIDTAQWFLTPDTLGVKYLSFRTWARENGDELQLPPGFYFDQGYGIYIEHPEHGGILAGLVAQKLVGVIGYLPEKQEQKFGRWLEGLRK